MEGRTALGATGALSFGAEWTRESLESTNLGDRSQDWRAVYGEVAFRRGGAQLQGGLRFDDRDDVGGFTSPSVSARWEGRGGVALRGAWGRTFRAPTWTERYYVDPANVGTPDLAVEEGWSGEAGLEYRHPQALVTVTGFVRETENLIDWARPVGSDASVPWETRNVEEATHRGVEISVQEVRAGALVLRATAAWLELEVQEGEGFLSKSSLRPIHREFTVQALVPLPDASRLSVLASDRSRLGGGGGLTADLRLEVPLGESMWYLDALNVTEADFPDITGLPIAGRRFMVGVRTPLGG